MILELALGTFDADLITNFEKREESRNIALFVCLKVLKMTRDRGHESRSWKTKSARRAKYLYKQVEAPEIIITTGRGVRAHDAFAIDFCLHGNVLSNGKPKDIVLVWKRESITLFSDCLSTDNPEK